MERPQRDFKGIWIPKEIWLSDQLSLIEKVLFVEIHSLDNERGCFASNRYFADFFALHERRIRAHIAVLKTKGFIDVTVENMNERVIRVTDKYARVQDKKGRAKRSETTRISSSQTSSHYHWSEIVERPQRDFKGIWIPKEIWLSDQLSLIDKVLFVEIQSLDNERGCFASNRYLANFFKIHERVIRTHLGVLKANGFIYVTVQNLNERIIKVTGRYARVPDSELRKLRQNASQLVHRMSLRRPGG